jgi:chaperone required for assembly of F1-ATPase
MKRFYREVSVVPAWQVQLDGRSIKTQGGQPQIVPSQALAAALAEEWAAQGETIDAQAFALRDLADYAIDVIAADPLRIGMELIPYAETDTLCYRADPEEPLYRRQLEVWEPLLEAAESRWDVRFARVSGIVHKPQPESTLERLRDLVAELDPFRLAALQTLTSLTASLVTGLSALEPGADLEALWNAANLEEDWQAALWGRDDEAEARRERRRAGFLTAAHFAGLAVAD